MSKPMVVTCMWAAPLSVAFNQRPRSWHIDAVKQGPSTASVYNRPDLLVRSDAHISSDVEN